MINIKGNYGAKRAYDIPVLAMIRAFNDFAGKEVDMGDLRDSWYFHMKTKDDNRFVYWLDKTLGIVNEDVTIVYKRNPGWYTGVLFDVKRVIEI